ncbi:hypothetical protein [Actinoplanes sp. NPDC049802]|uniref:hypothetical protein n=1 Tax=Actinoplanes sp. NPDC049802 TaxID=3154742 RepID=UPI0033D1A3F8
MRGTITAAVFASTLLAISGCATPGEPAGSAATAAPTVSISGLDDATASACTLANQATLGQDGYDFDVATANQIVTLGKQSKSTLITAATNVVEQSARQAEAAAGDSEEATHLAELRAAMLKFQTVCQNVDALTVSIQESQHALDADAGETTR